jgi:uncharacterized iron-regulated membrane protein
MRLRLPPALVRAAIDGHSALGLAVAALLFIVALTGTVAMFVPELDRLQALSTPRVDSVTPALAARTVAAIPGGPGAWQRISIEYPTDSLPRLTVTARGRDGEDQRFAVDTQGRSTAAARPWSDFLLDLHETLTVPGSAGMIIVGLLAHPRLFRDAFLYRAAAPQRVRQTDLHNRLSVWPLPFHIAIAFTGAALALSLPIAALTGTLAYKTPVAEIGAALLGPSPGKDKAPAPLPDIARIAAGFTGIQRLIVLQPATRGQIVRVDTEVPGRLVYGDRFFFDANGESLNPGGLMKGSPGASFLNGMFAVHFGSFGGLVVRIAYAFLGLALCTVIASGVRIWLARRRLRGMPLPMLERLWTGLIWGSALALSISFAGALLGLAAGTTFFTTLIGVLALSSIVGRGGQAGA